RPAVMAFGVGQHVAHNLIHDAPHSGVIIHGNDHLIEYNDMHHLCLETNDCGAFYIGRDWSERGNVVRYNYFHDLGKADVVQSIYLDDWTSGMLIYGNICYKGGRGIMVGGG